MRTPYCVLLQLFLAATLSAQNLVLNPSFEELKPNAVIVACEFMQYSQYFGEKIVAGQKGIVFSLVYQSSERTLTESEINPAHEKILQKLTQELSATIR